MHSSYMVSYMVSMLQLAKCCIVTINRIRGLFGADFNLHWQLGESLKDH